MDEEKEDFVILTLYIVRHCQDTNDSLSNPTQQETGCD